jgi:aminoglycoside phosphotransferase (APT) family kinase protein
VKDRASFDRMHAASASGFVAVASFAEPRQASPRKWWQRLRRGGLSREQITPEPAPAPHVLSLEDGTQIAVSTGRGRADRLLEELPVLLAREQGLPAGSLRIEKISIARGRSATCVLSDGVRARFVVKAPLSGRSLGRCEENLAVLRQIEGHPAIPADLSWRIPRPVGRLAIERQPVFVETALAGAPVARGLFRRRRARRRALGFLTELHAAARQQTPMDEALFEERIGHYCDRLAGAEAFSENGGQATVRGLKRRLSRGLVGRSWPLVPEHGDFHLGNCLFEGRGARLTGAIDWDLGSCPGLPVLDVLHFLVTSEGAGRLDAGTAAMLLRGDLPAESRTLLTDYAATLGIEPESLPTWMLLYVLVKLLVPVVTREGSSGLQWRDTVAVPALAEIERLR